MRKKNIVNFRIAVIMITLIYEDTTEWSFYFHGWKSTAESVYRATDYIMYSYCK